MKPAMSAQANIEANLAPTKSSQLLKKIDYDFLYTDITKIQTELQNRKKNDSTIREAIRKSLKLTPDLEKIFDSRKLIFFRQLATPTHEILHVLSIANKLNLQLIFLEYFDDKFVGSGNTFKRGLGKLPIHTFTTKDDQDIFENCSIVDFNKYTGKSIKDVKTRTGESLIDFHHELFDEITGLDISKMTVDGSSWFSSFSNGSKDYYKTFLKFFIYEHILAEIFLSTGAEKELSESVVVPAFQEIISEFNERPLILNYHPELEHYRFFWDCYPSKTTDFLTKKGYI
jgi:hypothetical protein